MEYVFRHIDETFDIDNCSNYILSIQCSLDGFSFCIFDKIINKYIVLSGYDFNAASSFQLKNIIDDIITSEPILNNAFERVKICYFTPKLTLTVSSLVGENQLENITSLNFEEERDIEIVSNKVSESVVSLSLIPVLIKDLFSTIFENSRFYTSLMPVLTHDSSLNQLGYRLHATLYKHWIQLVIRNENELRFANVFYVRNHNDCLYYILNVLKKNHLDSKTPIVLTGFFEKNTPVYSELKKYFETVLFGRFVNKYAFSYTFFKEPEHQYISLIELAQCE